MDERDWWMKLDGCIKIAEDYGFHKIELTFDEAAEIIKLLQELDDINQQQMDQSFQNEE